MEREWDKGREREIWKRNRESEIVDDDPKMQITQSITVKYIK